MGQGEDGLAGLERGLFPVLRLRREWNGRGGDADVRVGAAELQEAEDVNQEIDVPPVGDFVFHGDGGWVFAVERVVEVTGGDGLLSTKDLREEAAVEGQECAAIGGGAFRKEDDWDAGIRGGLEAGARALSGAAASTLDEDGARHDGEPTDDGPLADFRLGDEDAGLDGGKDDDIEVAGVVGDEGSVRWERAVHRDGKAEAAEGGGAEAMEPVGARFPSGGAEDEEFGAEAEEVGEELEGAQYGPTGGHASP